MAKENVKPAETPLTFAKLHEQAVRLNRQFNNNFQNGLKLTAKLPPNVENDFKKMRSERAAEPTPETK